ncbi:hypothetical protein CW362_16435 [Streptomyces populi]|uniref:Uncharacterized protein n=1 Tax=Streptomyces populi TaxID=2058924 RepID=A0A2I0SPJ3_9ACTN|nr:hypothetical protein [Streptomyces populi]PKT71848.1 hypothetical protein CW362_16435 [Streptomyces populi]
MTASCGLCERQLEHGYLCPGCTLGTAQRLDRAPRLYEALAAFLHPAGRRPEFGRSARSEAPLPIAEPAFNLRGPGGIVGVLEDWRSAMQADRGWGQPVIDGTTERRVAVAARALSINIEWIASSWPMAGAFAEEIRDLERDVASIVNPRDPKDRPRRLGYCPTLLDEVLCGAVVALLPGRTSVSCSWCGAEWPPEKWLALAQAQTDNKEALEARQKEAS